MPDNNISNGYQSNQTPRNHVERGRPPNPQLNQPNQLQQHQQQAVGQQQQQQPQSYYGQSATGPVVGNQQQQMNRGPNPMNPAGVQGNRSAVALNRQQQLQQMQGPGQQQQQQQKKPKYFLAMFDYDPTTMSPNPDGCEEELPFQEGDTIKVSLVVVRVKSSSTLLLVSQKYCLSLLLWNWLIGIDFLKSLCGLKGSINSRGE